MQVVFLAGSSPTFSMVNVIEPVSPGTATSGNLIEIKCRTRSATGAMRASSGSIEDAVWKKRFIRGGSVKLTPRHSRPLDYKIATNKTEINSLWQRRGRPFAPSATGQSLPTNKADRSELP